MPLIKNIEELEKLCGFKLTKKQSKAFRRKEKFLLYGGSCASGKSFFISAMAIYYALRYDSAVCLIARKYLSALKKTTQVTLERLIPNQFLEFHNKHESFFQFKNGSRIYCVGLAESRESLDKIGSMEATTFAVDEAQDLDTEEAFKILSTRLRLEMDGSPLRGFVTCNPTRKKWLRDLFVDKKRKDFYFLKALPSDNPHLPKSYIKDQKRVLSENQFKVLMLGDWDLATEENNLFDPVRVEAAMKRRKYKRGAVSFGVDLGEGTSETVIAKKHGNVIELPVIVQRKIDILDIANRLKKLVQNKKTRIYVDAIGRGSGLIEILKKDGFNVIGVRQYEAARNQDMYFNQRAENYDRINEFIDMISLPDDMKLKNEMLSCRTERDEYNRLKIEAKSKLIAKKISPSRLDAIVMASIEADFEEFYEEEKTPAQRMFEFFQIEDRAFKEMEDDRRYYEWRHGLDVECTQEELSRWKNQLKKELRMRIKYGSVQRKEKEIIIRPIR